MEKRTGGKFGEGEWGSCHHVPAERRHQCEGWGPSRLQWCYVPEEEGALIETGSGRQTAYWAADPPDALLNPQGQASHQEMENGPRCSAVIRCEAYGGTHCNLSLTLAQHKAARRCHPTCPKPTPNQPLARPENVQFWHLGSTNERLTYCWSTFQWSLPTNKPALFPPHSYMGLPFKVAEDKVRGTPHWEKVSVWEFQNKGGTEKIYNAGSRRKHPKQQRLNFKLKFCHNN